MPLPKRPSGGAIPKKVAPPESGEQGSSNVEDFALPELDDFTLPDLSFEPEAPIEEVSSLPRAPKAPAAVADSSREQFSLASSNDPEDLKTAQAAVSDRLVTSEDEDEETALNRELGLLDDEVFVQPKADSLVTHEESSEDESDEDFEETPSSLVELEEDIPESSETDDDDDFENLLRGLEQTISGTDDDGSEDDSEELESSPIVDSESTDLDADWEAALSELEALSIDAEPESQEFDSDEDEEDSEDEDDEEFDLSGFVPPENSFAVVPPDFDEDDDAEESENSDLGEDEEDDFVPPSDPFANPFANEVPRSRKSAESEKEIEEEIEEPEEGDEPTSAPRGGSLKDKVTAALSPAKAKRGLANYFAKINAELHGEELPKSVADSEDEESFIDEDESLNDRPARGQRSGTKVFGFLAPIRAIYTGIVNFIFAILTTVLGILAKLPLIGFVFKIALEATRVLRAIAQYLPLAFFIGGLVAVSYFSVPRDSLIVLPDSGGATFDNFKYDAGANTAVGTITNTGDIIADVQPIFEVRAINPSLNPVSWVIPEAVSKCEANSVRVDIDSTMNVTAKCSEPITGFFPRVTGELK